MMVMMVMVVAAEVVLKPNIDMGPGVVRDSFDTTDTTKLRIQEGEDLIIATTGITSRINATDIYFMCNYIHTYKHKDKHTF